MPCTDIGGRQVKSRRAAPSPAHSVLRGRGVGGRFREWQPSNELSQNEGVTCLKIIDFLWRNKRTNIFLHTSTWTGQDIGNGMEPYPSAIWKTGVLRGTIVEVVQREARRHMNLVSELGTRRLAGTMSTARLAKLPHHVLVEFAARACENSGVLKSEADALLARHIPPLPQWCVEVLHLPDVLLCCMRHATPADLSAAAACCSTWRPIVQDAVAMHPAAEGLMAGKSNPTVARLHRVIDGLQRASQLADRLQEIDATPGTPYARSQILLGLALLAACDDTRGCLRLRLAKEHFTAICRLLDELGPEQPLEAFDFAFEIFMAMDLPRDPDCVLLAHKYVLPRLALRVPFRKSGLSKRSAWQLLASLPPAWLEEHALPLLLPYIQGEVQPSVHSRGGPLEVLASLSQATIMRHVALVMTLLEDSFELAETETCAAGKRQSEALYAGCMSLAVLVRLPPAWRAVRCSWGCFSV